MLVLKIMSIPPELFLSTCEKINSFIHQGHWVVTSQTQATHIYTVTFGLFHVKNHRRPYVLMLECGALQRLFTFSYKGYFQLFVPVVLGFPNVHNHSCSTDN